MDKIAAALAKAQAKFVQPQKNKTVTVVTKAGQKYTFEYADYNAIVEAVRGPLSENGICFTHLIEIRNEKLMLATKLIHSSGQVLESLWPISGSSDPKEFGGDMTYGKRYSLSAITGCVADDDADAEPENVQSFKDRPARQANAQFTPPGNDQKPGKVSIKPAAATQGASLLSEAQIKRLFAIAKSGAWTHDMIKRYMLSEFGIDSTHDLSREQYDKLIADMQKDPEPDLKD